MFFVTNFQIVQEKWARAIGHILLLVSYASENVFNVGHLKADVEVIIVIESDKVLVQFVLLEHFFHSNEFLILTMKFK